MTKQQLEKY